MMKNIPRFTFAHLPTPIEPLKNLSAYLNGPQLWIKRDDQTGLAFGGNKTRKLEFLLAEAVANGAKTLITAGAQQSNHCRQTAAAACKFGLDCVLILSRNEDVDSVNEISGNLLLDNLLGTEIIWTTYDQRSQVLDASFQDLWKQGRRPYLIPIGGSNATGAAGYLLALIEMVDQIKNNDNIPFPTSVVIASSSGGTQAGLVAGQHILHLQLDILGISIDETKNSLQNRVAIIAREVCSFVGKDESINTNSIQVNDNYLGAGYGVMGEAEREAILLFARKEGILLDPVYTGRAAAGLLDLIRNQYFRKSDIVLFWHTGGSPALFASQYNHSIV